MRIEEMRVWEPLAILTQSGHHTGVGSGLKATAVLNEHTTVAVYLEEWTLSSVDNRLVWFVFESQRLK